MLVKILTGCSILSSRVLLTAMKKKNQKQKERLLYWKVDRTFKNCNYTTAHHYQCLRTPMKNNQALIFALNSICYAIQSLHASGHNLFCFKKNKGWRQEGKKKVRTNERESCKVIRPHFLQVLFLYARDCQDFIFTIITLIIIPQNVKWTHDISTKTSITGVCHFSFATMVIYLF